MSTSIKLGSPVVVKLGHQQAKAGALRAAVVNSIHKQGESRSYGLTVFLTPHDMASRHAPCTMLMHGVTEGTKEGQCQLVGATWPAPVLVAPKPVQAAAIAAPENAKPSAEDQTVLESPAPAQVEAPAPAQVEAPAPAQVEAPAPEANVTE